MRALQVTLFMVLLTVIATQTLRHVYVKWIEPKGSALDEFREKVDEDIETSKSLDELKAMYAKALASRKEFEGSRSLRDLRLARETDRPELREEQELREAIQRVEDQRDTLFKLRFYWFCGLASIVLGLLTYAKVNRWLGMVGIGTGFVEMASWTSPLWRGRGPRGEFDRLLTHKLSFSLASMVLLVALWLWSERRRRRLGDAVPVVGPRVGEGRDLRAGATPGTTSPSTEG
jgi:hypothetical protein